MREIFGVWKKPRLLVLASYTAAIYAAVLIPFKYGLPLVPGTTEIRPGVAVLFLCSFLFGPAAAWGGAFGNLIGDFFGGGFGVQSVFGFVGNFMLGYLPWRMWGMLRGGRAVPGAAPLWWARYLTVMAFASAACAGFIAWGIDLLFGLPFIVLADIIFINNFAMAIVLTPLLLGLIVPRMEAWGYNYDRMEPTRRGPGAVAYAGMAITFAATGLLMLAGNILARQNWIDAVAGFVRLPEYALKHRPMALIPIIVVMLAGLVLSFVNKRRAKENEVADIATFETIESNLAVMAKSIEFTYSGTRKPALKFGDKSFEVGKSEFVAVMGRTGAGKTSLARCLTGAAPHFYPGRVTGWIHVEGADPKNSGPADNADAVGMVFEDFESQLFSTSVELEVAFGPENLGMTRERMVDNIPASLAVVGLEGFSGRDPLAMSGGEKQRLAIAAILAMDTPVMILDEPSTDLDPVGKEHLYSVMGALAGEKALLLIEHEAEAAERADRIYLMADGAIDTAGPAEEILASPDLLEKHGVRPHDSVKMLSALGDEKPVIGTSAAVDRLKQLGATLDEREYGTLLVKDEARKSTYGEEIIRVDDLRRSYGKKADAVGGVNLSIRKGEFVAILGHNGSGKTTLAKHLNGLLEPTSGRVSIDGKPVSEMPLSDVARRVGYVFQNPDHQIFSATVAREVSFAPTNFGFARDEIDMRVAEALEATGLTGREDEDPFHMTKGERQRVAVAGVLAGAPDTIILDEPTTGLDLDEQRSVMELLKRLNEAGHTVIIITHTVWVAAQYAHRTVLMAGGKILADGPTREIFADSGALEAARVKPPQATEIGLQAYDRIFLSVDELIHCLKRGDG